MKCGNRSRIKVFLIDGHPALREGVRSALAHESIVVVGEASDGEEALRKVGRSSPDVIVLESSSASIDGGELSRRLRQVVSKARIIAFSAQASRAYVVRMARCGARGYVTKDAPTAQLIKAILNVHRGELHFPSDMADDILAPQPRLSSESSTRPELTSREREVLMFLSDGLANKEVARKLAISVRTVETHRENLSHKLNITNVAGLTKYAISQGLTSL